jgi:hypothetical protein
MVASVASKKRWQTVVAGLTRAIGSQAGQKDKMVKRKGRERKERISSVVVVVAVSSNGMVVAIGAP